MNKMLLAGLLSVSTGLSWASAPTNALKGQDLTFLEYNHKKDFEERQQATIVSFSGGNYLPKPAIAIVPYDQALQGKDFMRLFRSCFDYDKKQVYYVPDKQEAVKVLLVNDMFAGLVTYSFKSKDTAHLEYLAVTPIFRTFKLGTMLLNHVLDDVRQYKSIKRLTTCPLSKSIKFFRKKGFKPCVDDIFLFEKQL